MHVQVLSSGSAGNSALLRSGETHLLLDAGLPLDDLEERLAAARVPARRIHHIALTHGHLDHARSAGALAGKADARVHCAENMMRNASLVGAARLAALPIGRTVELRDDQGNDPVSLRAVPVPHDADPTVAFRIEACGRVVVLVTDLGRPDADAARQLGGAHVLLLEFNHDAELLRKGPYPPTLKRRVGGPRGHLSNDEASAMLRLLAGPELHTLVITHLSRTNNTPRLALDAARKTLQDLDRSDVRVELATQDTIGENLLV